MGGERCEQLVRRGAIRSRRPREVDDSSSLADGTGPGEIVTREKCTAGCVFDRNRLDVLGSTMRSPGSTQSAG